jgi:hypothetical protein
MRGRIHRGVGSICVLSMALLAGAARGEESLYCAVEGPESVLCCLAEAYIEQDFPAYGLLFASDYVYEFGEISWGLEEELAATSRLFDPERTKKLGLTIEDGYRIVPGESPDTWAIENVRVRLAMDIVEVEKVAHYDGASAIERLDIRREEKPSEHYVITRWVQGPGE